VKGKKANQTQSLSNKGGKAPLSRTTQKKAEILTHEMWGAAARKHAAERKPFDLRCGREKKRN